MTGAVPEGADTPRYAEVRAYAGTPAHADDTHEPIVLSSLLRQESSAQALMAPAAPLQEIQGYELPGAQQSDSGWPEDTVAEAPVAPEAGAEGAPRRCRRSPPQRLPRTVMSSLHKLNSPICRCWSLCGRAPWLKKAALMPTVALADPDPRTPRQQHCPKNPALLRRRGARRSGAGPWCELPW